MLLAIMYQGPIGNLAASGALRDCKRLFEMADRDFGYKMTLLDIRGGFPGETHSMW